MMRCFTKLHFWRAALALLVVGITAWSAAVAARTPPAAGRFLVATRRQQGFFSKTVILLVAYGPGGAFGVVVNRPTKLALAKVLPDPGVLHGRADRVYIGGPVSLDDLTMLFRSPSALPESIHVVDGVYASSSMAALRAAVGRKLTDASFRAYAGYAGWAPGQLEAELEQGAWAVVSAHADDVFTVAPGKLWDKLSRQGNVLLVQLAPLTANFRVRPHDRVSPNRSIPRGAFP